MDWIQLAQDRFLCTYGNNTEYSLTGTAFHGCIHMIIFPQRFCFTEVFSQIYWFIRKGCQGVIWDWTRNLRELAVHSLTKAGQGLSQRALCYKSLGMTQLQQKAAKHNDEAANTALYSKGHLFVMSGY